MGRASAVASGSVRAPGGRRSWPVTCMGTSGMRSGRRARREKLATQTPTSLFAAAGRWQLRRVARRLRRRVGHEVQRPGRRDLRGRAGQDAGLGIARERAIDRVHSQAPAARRPLRQPRRQARSASDLGILYNTTQGVVGLRALGEEPEIDPIPVIERLLAGDAYKKLPWYTTSFFPLLCAALGKPFPGNWRDKLRGTWNRTRPTTATWAITSPRPSTWPTSFG